MGLLVDGQWHDKWYDTKASDGKFVRSESQFRNAIKADGSSRFTPDSGRYHLYVSLACPWAHRTLIFRQLKQLTDHISVSVVSPDMLAHGWKFDDKQCQDDLFQSGFLHQIYTKADPHYSGRVTVPILWDKQLNTIVSNESADIIRMFNREFNGLTGNTLDFYPAALQSEIDEVNEQVYHKVNNGVYKAGFATTQEAYLEAFHSLFSQLDAIEERLSQQDYLVGDTLTEADWRLFTTLIRFDAVYVGHFKCNLYRIADKPHLQAYLERLYHMAGVKQTVDMYHIKRHYYFSHTMINPTQVVPQGPALPFL
ncbi:glutathione S-transferase family protein [Motilimonas pumila]|uniref:Glutathione S-transferase family protein n=1 Tax=Motilimonas pumila TaxID=2303987 RepID=A0A418YA16_9GAMM|nr:glutathione S-transferase family protein [Motilimonas pumila]RJG38624.1 glutathione S-transferase family protein [Motilimonas pumila]